MGRRDYLGEFEQLIVLAILRLSDNAYGMTIRREIEEQTGRQTSIGALYLTLERLEQKGFVSSSLGVFTPEKGGRAKTERTLSPTREGRYPSTLVGSPHGPNSMCPLR